ncbi:hypothetical protein HZB02_04225 [Candidatus Woesearchaeota archaeon]|nr:hypothetical protein [Candidatus Woesearchaeota archaeon]
MNQKQIGIIILIIGIALALTVVVMYQREQKYIIEIAKTNGGSCILENGICLHDQLNIAVLIGSILSGVLIILGFYLSFVDKTQQQLEQHQVKITTALADAKKSEKEKDEFAAFLQGFSQDEQTVLKVIKEEEGIEQATLRYKTDLSKTALSLMLASLEERGIIARKPSGKTNKVFLVKRI